MARGNAKRQEGRHRFYNWTMDSAANLASARAQLDGMHGGDPEFELTLEQAIGSAGEMAYRATRMDKGSKGCRASLEQMMAQCVLSQPEVQGV